MGVDFYRWPSMYHLAKQHAKKSLGVISKNDGPLEAYSKLERFFESRKDLMSIISTKAELEWFQHGNPYYKIWPKMANALSNISIDIEGRFFHMPYPTIEICLPKGDGAIRESAESPILCSILLYLDNWTKNYKHAKLVEDGRDYSLMVHYQFDVDVDKDYMGYYFRLGITKDKTLSQSVEDVMGASTYYMDGYVPSPDFVRKIVRIAVATCFFGINNHEQIMPDIPYKFIEKYHSAVARKDKSEAEKLLDKAKRLGHFGWKVGSELDLPRPIVHHETKSSSAGTGKELLYGHLRSGHMRMQKYGSKADANNPERYELIFIPPTTVRPDLPLRDMRGFRLKDDILTAKK